MYWKDTCFTGSHTPKELHKGVRNNTAYYDFKWESKRSREGK